MIASGSLSRTALRTAAASSASSTTGWTLDARSLSALSGERVVPITSCPRATSCGTSRLPIAPVAPARKTLIVILLSGWVGRPSPEAPYGRPRGSRVGELPEPAPLILCWRSGCRRRSPSPHLVHPTGSTGARSVLTACTGGELSVVVRLDQSLEMSTDSNASSADSSVSPQHSKGGSESSGIEIRHVGSLLEREHLLGELGDSLTQAQQGNGRVVLIEAPAGLGKTSLLDVACETATEAGFTCLRARATELEREFAYGCVRQWLEPLVARTSPHERDHLLEGAAALSMPLFRSAGDARVPQSAESVFSMLHGLYWLLNNVAGKSPLILAVDDIHWSDTESLRFCNYLAVRLDGLRLVLLAASRTGDDSSADLARLAAAPETVL